MAEEGVNIRRGVGGTLLRPLPFPRGRLDPAGMVPLLRYFTMHHRVDRSVRGHSAGERTKATRHPLRSALFGVTGVGRS